MGRWDRGEEGRRHLEHALSAVEAMGTMDAVVVPKTPSVSMIAVGARTGGVSKEAAARIYRAMVLAAGR